MTIYYGTVSSTNSPPNRIGQVSHSVVLGTVNISDQREGMGLLPDIGRVVGAVLQSIGAGILSPAGDTCKNIVSDWTDNGLDSAIKSIETRVTGISTAADIFYQMTSHLEHSLITGGMRGPASSKPVNTSTTKEKSSEDKMKSIAESSKSGGTDRTTPLGLGLGGLQPKKRSNVAKPIVKDGKSHDSSSVSQNLESISRGQELLRSIVSHVSDGNRDSMNSSSGPFPFAAFNQFARSINFVGQDSRERVNAGDLMSQVLGSPAFNNFLTNFGGVPSQSPSVSVNESGPESQSYNTIKPDERIHKSELQIDLHEAQQKIEQNDSSGSIFRAMLESAGGLYGEYNHEGLLQELGDDVELSNEYSEILHRHIQQRLAKESESKEKF